MKPTPAVSAALWFAASASVSFPVIYGLAPRWWWCSAVFSAMNAVNAALHTSRALSESMARAAEEEKNRSHTAELHQALVHRIEQTTEAVRKIYDPLQGLKEVLKNFREDADLRGSEATAGEEKTRKRIDALEGRLAVMTELMHRSNESLTTTIEQNADRIGTLLEPLAERQSELISATGEVRDAVQAAKLQTAISKLGVLTQQASTFLADTSNQIAVSNSQIADTNKAIERRTREALDSLREDMEDVADEIKSSLGKMEFMNGNVIDASDSLKLCVGKIDAYLQTASLLSSDEEELLKRLMQ